MNKSKLLALLLIFLSVIAKSQIFDPVTWNFRYVSSGDNQYELVFTANIEKGSYIYAMKIPEGGPIPTSFRIDSIPDFSLSGSVFEVSEPVVKFDEAFGFKIGTLSDIAEFRQKITGNKPSFKVTGEVSFMACNNATCTPPKSVEFEIQIGERAAFKAGSSVGFQDKGITPARERSGLAGFFILSILAGLAGILTPCVFPMIPMTVAFFSRDNENRSRSIIKAIIFGVSIMLIYTSLGVIVALSSAGAGIANALSTHWIPNTIFFGLFVVFAISFFGAFEIVLPNKWVAGADSKVDKGGLAAAFFMGLTTVIVSFSCTGPIVGALLVEAASGDILRPVLGMFGFGLAFALPFTLFALFPAILKKMPRSGGWLNSIKVVLGFIMLAFSLKFLMTVDSVYRLGILSRDLFLAIWIVLFSMLGLYLAGKIRFSHDSEMPYIGTFRLFLIIAVFTFVVYLIPGLFGAPLTRISAMLPSQGTSWFSTKQLPAESNSTQTPAFRSFTPTTQCAEPKFGDIFKMPLGLQGYFEYNQGLECAREQGKPVLIDFKGHACANCKLMEARVWSDPEVLRRLRENFVIVALYVDDRTQLPENEWIVSKIDGKVKKTIGKVNEDMEISKFNTNALPLYVITDHDGNALNKPMPSNMNVEEYKRWLDEGAEAFKTSRTSR